MMHKWIMWMLKVPSILTVYNSSHTSSWWSGPIILPTLTARRWFFLFIYLLFYYAGSKLSGLQLQFYVWYYSCDLLWGSVPSVEARTSKTHGTQSCIEVKHKITKWVAGSVGMWDHFFTDLSVLLIGGHSTTQSSLI